MSEPLELSFGDGVNSLVIEHLVKLFIYMDYSNISGFDEAIIAVDVFPGSDSTLLSLDRVRNAMTC